MSRRLRLAAGAEPVDACMRLDPESVQAAVSRLRREQGALGVPALAAEERLRLAQIDGAWAADQALALSLALIEAPEVEAEIGVSAEDIGELCNRRAALGQVEEAARRLSACALDTVRLFGAFVMLLDEEVRAFASEDAAAAPATGSLRHPGGRRTAVLSISCRRRRARR